MMPYKIHKTSGGKFKLYRQATDGKPARPMSDHPQTKETATAQLRAVEANTNPENHSMMCMYSLKKSPNGKYQVSRNGKLETMSGPPNEKRNKEGKWEAKKPHSSMETMAGPPGEARDDTGKWTSGPGSQGGSKPQSGSSGSSGQDFTKEFGLTKGDLAAAGRGGKQSMVGSPPQQTQQPQPARSPVQSKGQDFTKAFGLINADLAAAGRGGKQSMVGSPPEKSQPAQVKPPSAGISPQKKAEIKARRNASQASPIQKPQIPQKVEPIQSASPSISENKSTPKSLNHLDDKTKQEFYDHIKNSYGWTPYIAKHYFNTPKGKKAFQPEYNHFAYEKKMRQ